MSTSPASAATKETGAAAIYSGLNGKADKKAAAGGASELQDRFLTLLTTQLKNQDPLNPLDNAQMTSQLAQISTVEGIGELNRTLQKLLANAADSQTFAAAALVGQKVLVPGEDLHLGEGGGQAGVELGADADKVTATITDANGLVVRTVDLGAMAAGVHDFAWDGIADGGARAANGRYSVRFAANQGENNVTATSLTRGVVGAVTKSAEGVALDIEGRGRINMSDIKKIL